MLQPMYYAYCDSKATAHTMIKFGKIAFFRLRKTSNNSIERSVSVDTSIHIQSGPKTWSI